MTYEELLLASAASLRAHKLRSFLTLLGIIIGVATVVAVASVISGLNTFVQEKVIRLAPDVFVITKFGIIKSREEFLDALKRPDLGPRDLQRLKSTLRRTEALAADVTTRSAVKHRDRRLGDTTVHGCTSNYGDVLGKEVEAGRWFAEADDLASHPIAVIGWDVKEELFPRQDPVGRSFTIGGVPFRVAGVVARQGNLHGFTEDTHVYVPMSTFRRTWGARSSIDVLIKARGGVPGVEASIDEARAVVRALRHTPFRSPDPFGVITAENLQELWRQISAAAFTLTLLIASVSLGVGGVVIMNIMLVGVAERTREIGVCLAVGARKRDIRRQFLLEAALLSTCGGIVGVGLAAAVVIAAGTGWSLPVNLTSGIAAMGLGLSTAVGVAAGYWPARIASNLVVVDALRDET